MISFITINRSLYQVKTGHYIKSFYIKSKQVILSSHFISSQNRSLYQVILYEVMNRSLYQVILYEVINRSLY